MESKLYEECHEGGGFMAQQAMLKQDETVRTQISPDETLMEEIKALCQPILAEHRFIPVFFDITRTGRHLWIAIYFQIECGSLAVSDLSHAAADINAAAQERYQNCTCELILTPEESPYLGC